MNSLLPSGTSALEQRLARTASHLSQLPVNLRDLWSPARCPVNFLPYLAWAFSVDRWDEAWPEATRRQVVLDAFFIHQHKGTASALRRVIEPFGYVAEIREWWQTDDPPGTFRLDIGVQEHGISDETHRELERLINDAKPASRHLSGLVISLQTQGNLWLAAGSYSGEQLTVYPYLTETITRQGRTFYASASYSHEQMTIYPFIDVIISTGGSAYQGVGVHIVDRLSVSSLR